MSKPLSAGSHGLCPYVYCEMFHINFPIKQNYSPVISTMPPSLMTFMRLTTSIDVLHVGLLMLCRRTSRWATWRRERRESQRSEPKFLLIVWKLLFSLFSFLSLNFRVHPQPPRRPSTVQQSDKSMGICLRQRASVIHTTKQLTLNFPSNAVEVWFED